MKPIILSNEQLLNLAHLAFYDIYDAIYKSAGFCTFGAFYDKIKLYLDDLSSWPIELIKQAYDSIALAYVGKGDSIMKKKKIYLVTETCNAFRTLKYEAESEEEARALWEAGADPVNLDYADFELSNETEIVSINKE